MKIDKNKKPRTDLKSYFEAGDIPKQEEFAWLIDSGLNQHDDGIVKPAGDPLSIEAVGDDVGLKKALNFYMSFADVDPAWSISLRPRAKPADALTGQPGWSVNDAAGNSRLCINTATGNVGIGAVDAADKLEVTGRVRAGVISIGPWPPDPIGYGFIGSNLIDQTNRANYALLQGTGRDPGMTFLNSPSRVRIRIANSDRLNVDNDGATVVGSLKIAGSDLYFTETTHNHTGFGNSAGFAAIENAANHGALMILGRSIGASGPLKRMVKLWDWLEVNGTLDIVGDVSLRGKHAFRGSDNWLRLNQDNAFTAGTHTPGLFAPGSLNVGGRGGWANPGPNNAWIVGDLLVQGRIGAMNLGPGPKTPGWHGGMRTFDLEVEATVWARHGMQSGPRDLAEIYFATDPLESGDVVSLTDDDDSIVASGRAQDPRVIGIVSKNPGFLLGSLHNVDRPDDGRAGHPVALLGCVACKVSDEGGPIRRGDLLTAAPQPGHAMRADPGAQLPGTILGKALEPHDAGQGMIQVFVMLR